MNDESINQPDNTTVTDILEETLEQKINRETARILWQELAPHFAAGNLITVAIGVDLVAVAAAMARDDSSAIKAWMEAGQVAPTTDEDASTWHENNAEVWASVIKPWVLVQNVTAK